MNLLKELQNTKSDHKVLFDEYEDKRIIDAIKYLQKKNICKPFLISPKPIAGIQTINPEPNSEIINFVKKKLKCSELKAKNLLQESNWLATALVANGYAHAFISGASNPTSRTFKPALKLLADDYASSYFLMIGKQNWLFADCAFNINPNAKQLAKIAVDTAINAKKLGINPKVAMLSFSTNKSASDKSVTKVQQATTIAKNKLKTTNIILEGEMQFDAAIDPKVAKLKNPNSHLQGNANVFIFPDLNAGNIGYKIASRLGKIKAIGPITQGFTKPVNDLSRGCTVQEIILTTALTTKQIK